MARRVLKVKQGELYPSGICMYSHLIGKQKLIAFVNITDIFMLIVSDQTVRAETDQFTVGAERPI